MSRQTVSRVLITSLLASAAAGVILTTNFRPSATLAQTDNLCGTVATGDVELSADLVCEGDGITVKGNNLTVHMNGFTMRGSGSDSNTTGILVENASNVRIRGPGMISLFGTGVEYSGATGGALRDIYVGNNDIGVLLNSVVDTHVKQDHIADNRIGVLNKESANTEIENVQMSNNDEGIRMENSQSVDIDFNIIMDGLTGIYLDSQSIDNEVFYNILFRNELIDMEFASAQGNDTKNLLGFNECTQGNPTDVCLGRVLPSGQRLVGPGQSEEGSSERAISTEPEDLSPAAEQAASALRARVEAGESENQTQTGTAEGTTGLTTSDE